MCKIGHAFIYLLLKDIVANERLISVRCELDNSVVTEPYVIDEWRRRLSACVDADGGHFEHLLMSGTLKRTMLKCQHCKFDNWT